jgi:hypothetical protein
MSNYVYFKVLPPIGFGDHYEVQMFNDDDEFMEFETADTVEEVMIVIEKYLRKIEGEKERSK